MANPMNYSTNGLSMYATVQKQGAWDRRNLRRFVNISFAYGNDTAKVHIPSVMCQKDLFSYDGELLTIYNQYLAHLDPSYTFCPMADEYKRAVIQGSIDQKSSQTYSLEVARCNPSNTEGTRCAQPNEINAYMDQMRIQVNLIQNQINFGKYGEQPVSKFRRLIADE